MHWNERAMFFSKNSRKSLTTLSNHSRRCTNTEISVTDTLAIPKSSRNHWFSSWVRGQVASPPSWTTLQTTSTLPTQSAQVRNLKSFKANLKQNLKYFPIIIRSRAISSIFQYSHAWWWTGSVGRNAIGSRLDILRIAEIRSRPDGSFARSKASEQVVGARKFWPRLTKIAGKMI